MTIRRLLDLIAPRFCPVCGGRLDASATVVCADCYLHLPRTGFAAIPTDNPMARLLWGQMEVERVVALYYHESQSATANIVYSMKYKGRRDMAKVMGRLMAAELLPTGFFGGIDALVPVPLAKSRQRQRGYNQSCEIARGISRLTGIPIYDKVVRRTAFHGSQTKMSRLERQANVENVFELTDPTRVRGRHLLLIDDVLTTGATVVACSKTLAAAGDVKISVLTLTFAKS